MFPDTELSIWDMFPDSKSSGGYATLTLRPFISYAFALSRRLSGVMVARVVHVPIELSDATHPTASRMPILGAGSTLNSATRSLPDGLYARSIKSRYHSAGMRPNYVPSLLPKRCGSKLLFELGYLFHQVNAGEHGGSATVALDPKII